MKRIFVLLILVGVTGCSATMYKQPLATEPHSNFSVKRSIDKLGTLTWADSYDNDQCVVNDGYGRLAEVGLLNNIDKEMDTVRIDSGKETFFKFDGRLIRHEGLTTYFYDCLNLVSFTPKTGESYTAIQRIIFRKGCYVSITNDQTGDVVADLKQHHPIEQCKRMP